MTFALLSLSYKTTPVEVREKLDIPASRLLEVVRQVRQGGPFTDLMIVSTCNRVEFYFAAQDEAKGFAAIQSWMGTQLDGIAFDWRGCCVKMSGQAALTHLFRVACSLESMIIGEPQILGQVKEAYQTSVEGGCVSATLRGLMPRVFRAAKRVRNETAISRYAVSISYAAVELAGKIFETLSDKTVMVIGAGEMAELAVAHLVKTGINKLVVANRTYSNAVALAEKFQGEAVAMEDMEAALAKADIVISSTGARGFVITQELVRSVMKSRRGQPMFFIDIAVPRDIAPEVNDLPNAYCYDIDDLKQVTDSNRKEREREAMDAQKIVEEEVARYQGWSESLAVVPTVRALREQFHRIARKELDKTLPRLTGHSAQDAQLVERLAQTLINKLLHAPSTQIKQIAEEGDGKLVAEVLAQLFALQPGQEPQDESGASDEEAPSAKVVRFPGA